MHPLRFGIYAGVFWLFLFHKTLDEMYDGPVAARAKERSSSIAEVMKQRMGVMIEC